MFDLRKSWKDLLAKEAMPGLPESRWELDWSSDPGNMAMLHEAIRLGQPRVIVETGTFEGHGTFAMAKAAHENDNGAVIYTLDYDGDPSEKHKDNDWEALRGIRQENLDNIRARFPKCEVRFVDGDSRETLPRLFGGDDLSWDLFYQDSMHHYAGVMAEWKLMRSHASPRALVVFDDLCLRYRYPFTIRKRNRDFCCGFASHERWSGWAYRSTRRGHGQFWAQKKN